MRVGYVLLGLVTLTSVHISSANVAGRTHARCDASSRCAEGDQCSNNLTGLQNGKVCCVHTCGICGGPGCALRPGGADSCCVGTITDNGMLCSNTKAAPCVIDTCSNHVEGIQAYDVCCHGACCECGGIGCGGRPGGAANCCKGSIRNSDILCSDTSAAPCIIDDAVVCSDDTKGIEQNGACCEAKCGTCGGPGCGQRPGGKDACCTGVILNSQRYCDNTSMAPCIIGSPPA